MDLFIFEPNNDLNEKNVHEVVYEDINEEIKMLDYQMTRQQQQQFETMKTDINLIILPDDFEEVGFVFY